MGHRSAPEGFRVVICAPYGRDAESVANILRREGYDTAVCLELAEVAAEIGGDVGVVLITEEAFRDDRAALREALDAQPPWSDIPFIFLASHRTGPQNRVQEARSRLLDFVTNAITLERPLSLASLLSATRSAIRSRQKQFEMRDRLAERDVARQDLSQSEAQLRLATDAAEIGFWDVDPINATLYWPARVKAMFGISPEIDVSMADFYAGLHSDDAPATILAYEAAADPQRRALYDVEYRTIGKEDGVVRWVAAKGRGVFDDNGRCIRLIGTAIDITPRKADEVALRESEERLRLAMEAGEQGAWKLDIPTRRLEASSLCRANFGFGPTETFDYEDLLHSVHPDDRGRMQAAVARSIADHAIYDIDYRIVRRDGSEGWVHVRGKPEYAADGSPSRMIGVSSDVTARKKTELELVSLAETLEQRVADRTNKLMQAEAALHQSQKMEAVGQLTGGIAHDFNNMLTGVIGALDMMKRRMATGRVDHLERYIETASASAQRAAALTARLLAFSRRQSLDLKPVDVDTLVNSLEELLRRTIGENIELSVVAGQDVGFAVADSNQLENAIINLAINARDAMPDGGKLTVETRAVDIDATYVAVRPELKPGRYVVVAVSDTGVGMAPEVLAKVFEPFFTTKPLGQGTGLGLSMVYGFARQSGGQVRIHSQPGTGTSVSIYLPATEATSISDTRANQDAAPEGRGQTVLLVEDDPSVRLLVREVLEELAYKAVEVDSGVAALPILTSGRKIDLLISDVGLPGMNGRELAEVARKHHPRLPVLFITGYAENAAIRAGFLGTNMGMVTKPFVIEQLAGKIAEMLKL